MGLSVQFPFVVEYLATRLVRCWTSSSGRKGHRIDIGTIHSLIISNLEAIDISLHPSLGMKQHQAPVKTQKKHQQIGHTNQIDHVQQKNTHDPSIILPSPYAMNNADDDSPMDLEVPYFQRNPYQIPSGKQANITMENHHAING